MIITGKMKRGQGATEYLLILAIALVIATIAIVYIHVSSPRKPLVTMYAVYDADDGSIDVVVQSGSILSEDWKWRILNPDGSENAGWTDATVDLDPTHSPIELKELGTSPIGGLYTVQVYYEPTKSIYTDMKVRVISK
jgi:hypothetical protein